MTISKMVNIRFGDRGWSTGSAPLLRRATSLTGTVMVLIVTGALALGGCAPSLHVAAEPGQGADVAHEDATAARALISQLRNRPWADEAALELQRAEGWLNELEQRLANDEQGERTDALMLAVRTQLSAVKSFYAKREAQEALERVRGEGEDQ